MMQVVQASGITINLARQSKTLWWRMSTPHACISVHQRGHRWLCSTESAPITDFVDLRGISIVKYRSILVFVMTGSHSPTCSQHLGCHRCVAATLQLERRAFPGQAPPEAHFLQRYLFQSRGYLRNEPQSRWTFGHAPHWYSAETGASCGTRTYSSLAFVTYGTSTMRLLASWHINRKALNTRANSFAGLSE